MEERGKVKYIDINHVHLVKLLKYLGIKRNSKVDGIVLIKTETYLPKLEVIKLPWVPKHSKGLRKATIYDTPDLRGTFYLFVLIRRLEPRSDVYTISTKFNKEVGKQIFGPCTVVYKNTQGLTNNAKLLTIDNEQHTYVSILFILVILSFVCARGNWWHLLLYVLVLKISRQFL